MSRKHVQRIYGFDAAHAKKKHNCARNDSRKGLKKVKLSQRDISEIACDFR